MASPTLLGAVAASSVASTSNAPRCTLPANILNGDIGVLWVSSNTGSETYGNGANWPGWKQVGSSQVNSTVLQTTLFIKRLTSADSSTATGPQLGGSRRWTCSAAVIRNGVLEQVTQNKRTSTSTITSIAFGAVRPSTADALILAFGQPQGQGNAGTSYTFTSGANYTEQTDVCTSQASQLEAGASIAIRTLSGGAGSTETPSNMTTSQNVAKYNNWTLCFAQALGTFGAYGDLV